MMRMNRLSGFVFSFAIMLLSGCDMVTNADRYRDTTEEFMEAVIREDYHKCVDLIAWEHELAARINKDTLQKGLVSFRKVIVSNWGTELVYSFARSQKKYSTVEAANTPPNTTQVYVEFHNNKEFGMLETLFDDTSGKILNIKTLDVKGAVPNLTSFWMFGVLALCIPVFNIFVIMRIKRSSLKKKWLRYLAVLFFNVPAFTYSAVQGISVGLLSFQILLGVSFGWMGYLNSYWTFGIPLGGLYWLWKLDRMKRNPAVSPVAEDPPREDHQQDPL